MKSPSYEEITRVYRECAQGEAEPNYITFTEGEHFQICDCLKADRLKAQGWVFWLPVQDSDLEVWVSPSFADLWK